MAGNLTIGALLAQAIDRLRDAGAGARAADDPGSTAAAVSDRATHTLNAEHHLDAELLLAHALSMSRTQIKTHPDNVPSNERAQRYAELINRRARGEPVAYILGYRD